MSAEPPVAWDRMIAMELAHADASIATGFGVHSGLAMGSILTCGSEAQRAVAQGRDSTHAVRASDGKRVWSFRDGKYANPVVADEKRMYITGQSHQYAFAPRGSEGAREDAQADRAARDKERDKNKKKRQKNRQS